MAPIFNVVAIRLFIRRVPGWIASGGSQEDTGRYLATARSQTMCVFLRQRAIVGNAGNTDRVRCAILQHVLVTMYLFGKIRHRIVVHHMPAQYATTLLAHMESFVRSPDRTAQSLHLRST